MVDLNQRLKEFRASLRVIRKQQGLNQTQLAKRAEMSAAQISNIETGKAVPRLDTVLLLADALGVDLIDLLAPKKQGREVDFIVADRDRGECLQSLREAMLTMERTLQLLEDSG